MAHSSGGGGVADCKCTVRTDRATVSDIGLQQRIG